MDGHGVGSDSFLGPDWADMFISYTKKKSSNEWSFDFNPILYRRYVDDIFLNGQQ